MRVLLELRHREPSDAALRAEQSALQRRHALVEDVKEACVLAHAADPVAAYARPVVVPAGIDLFHATSAPSLRCLLADGLRLDVPRLFGDPPHGPGLYLSLFEPAYLSASLPVALHLRTASPLAGVRLKPLEWFLRRQWRVDGEAIRRLYARVKRRSLLVQGDGPPPADTELALHRACPALRLVRVLHDGGDSMDVGRYARECPSHCTALGTRDAPRPLDRHDFITRRRRACGR